MTPLHGNTTFNGDSSSSLAGGLGGLQLGGGLDGGLQLGSALNMLGQAGVPPSTPLNNHGHQNFSNNLSNSISSHHGGGGGTRSGGPGSGVGTGGLGILKLKRREMMINNY
jgi:hypothetical protein